MTRNMGTWHRLLYGVGGAAGVAWGLLSEPRSFALVGLGAIGLLEALTGV